MYPDVGLTMQVLSPEDRLDCINTDASMSLRVEPIPADQMEVPDGDHIVHVYHFRVEGRIVRPTPPPPPQTPTPAPTCLALPLSPTPSLSPPVCLCGGLWVSGPRVWGTVGVGVDKSCTGPCICCGFMMKAEETNTTALYNNAGNSCSPEAWHLGDGLRLSGALPICSLPIMQTCFYFSWGESWARPASAVDNCSEQLLDPTTPFSVEQGAKSLLAKCSPEKSHLSCHSSGRWNISNTLFSRSLEPAPIAHACIWFVTDRLSAPDSLRNVANSPQPDKLVPLAAINAWTPALSSTA